MKKRLLYSIISLFAFYIFLVFQASNIETTSSFPAIWIDFEDGVKWDEINWNFEEINIDDWNWNNINWVYVWNWKGKTVYFFHWNWWPIDYFYNWINYIHSLWYNVLCFDYPWYWKSTWFPDKDLVSNFSQVFYDYVKKEKWLEDSELIIWWYSIGAAVSIDFATKNDFEKIVLFSPFASRHDMAKSTLGFNLSSLLFLENSYISKELVKDFNKPLLLVHWNSDKIIPFDQWKLVFNNYWENTINEYDFNKYLIEIDWFWHNWIIENYWDTIKYKVWDFLRNWEIKFNDEYILLDDNLIQKSEEEREKIKDKIEAKMERQRKMHIFLDKLKIKKLEVEQKEMSDLLKLDSSITRFVNNKVSFNDKTYVPDNLVSIKSSFVIDAKWNQLLREDAKNALVELSKEFYEVFETNIKIISAYRSYNYQKWIKDWWCPDNLCAKAWFSEHQTWLAIDVWEATTNKQFLSKSKLKNYFEWLSDNAHKYWFHNTYQKWLEIDWYEIEPWHWRYLWIDLATELYNNHQTFAEYYNLNK